MSNPFNITVDRFETTEDYVWEVMPHRIEDSHKGTYGKLMIVAGSLRFRGAAALCTEGALRSGTGIVTLASIEQVYGSVQSRLPECCLLPCRMNTTGGISSENIGDIIDELDSGYTALAIGPGLGNTEDASILVRDLITGTHCAVLIDADGLNVLAPGPHPVPKDVDPVRDIYAQGDMAGIDFSALPEGFAKVKDWPVHPGRTSMVVTPHPGEMARLLGLSVSTVKAHLEEIAFAFAKDNNCVVLLKDHRSVIASPRGKIWRNTTGNSGLARGGSGDILAGLIGSFLALGMDPFDAAVCGAWLHGKSADLCAARLSRTGMLPHDIFSDLQQLLIKNGR